MIVPWAIAMRSLYGKKIEYSPEVSRAVDLEQQPFGLLNIHAVSRSLFSGHATRPF